MRSHIVLVIALVLVGCVIALWVRSMWIEDFIYLEAGRNYFEFCSDNGEFFVTWRSSDGIHWPRMLLSRASYSSGCITHRIVTAWYGGSRAGTYWTRSANPGDIDFAGTFVVTREYWFPLWVVVSVAAIWPTKALVFRLRTRYRARRGLCTKCGYDLNASPERCPECGASLPGSPPNCGAAN